MAQYNHTAIESKWRENWEKNPINVNDGKKEKYYCLDMFPYPSGSGLHVGHWRGYVISDVWSRYQLLKGKYVIHPMGWDAFGLPAENYAIKMGVHPAISTASNIKNIKRQINQIAALYDWDMEVNTTDPSFYKWTQWIFVQMFKKGLAYEKEFPINWCPSCKTGLANEEVVNGCCERCGTPVTKKNLRQWMLKITAYADRLLDDLDKLDWPEKVKKMQTDWIGKSYGAEVEFPVKGRDEKITVYTTRPDTLHGATFMVLPPAPKLELQALGQVTRAHARRVQRLEQAQPLLQHRGGQSGRLGQVFHLLPEIPGLVQAGRQKLGSPEHQGGGLAALQLPGQVEQKGVLQPAVRPDPGQRIQLLPLRRDVLPVLVVLVGQRLHPPPQLLPLVRPLLRLGQLGGGVLLNQLLQICLQLLGAHLQDLHGLEHLRRQFQFLFLGHLQLHRDPPPRPSNRLIYLRRISSFFTKTTNQV